MAKVEERRGFRASGARALEWVAPERELVELLESALRGARTGSVRVYILEALGQAITHTLSAPNKPRPAPRAPAPIRPWSPRPDQIWHNGMRTEDDRRITAWDVFQTGYNSIPKHMRPFAHQVRQHPKTKELYDALCVFVSRNKTKGVSPSSIADLFPTHEQARGGMLSENVGARAPKYGRAKKRRESK